MADPRGGDTKDRMNQIKRRQKFRPFVPVILVEHTADYFEMTDINTSGESPYMQYAVRCKQASEFPAIVHAVEFETHYSVKVHTCDD